MKMKRIFRRNQIIITTLAIMIAAAGYLNYSGKKEVQNGEVFEAGATEISDEDILAENQVVSGQEKDVNPAEDVSSDMAAAENAVKDAAGNASEKPVEQAAGNAEGTYEEIASLDDPGEAVLTGGTTVTEYIAGVQLSREQIRAKNKDTLLQIINHDGIDEASKQAAVQSMIALTAVSEKENAAETLLMAKGFADPVVSMTDGKVDVVINAAAITDPQRAQVEDIVKRKTEVGAENIVITLLNLQE
ncbi:MAG: SpoIIIAH-like family protein [Clostridium sp.]